MALISKFQNFDLICFIEKKHQIYDRILNIIFTLFPEHKNSGIDEIQLTAKYINLINNSLQVIKDLLNGTITTLTALNILKTASSAAAKFIPVVPGAVTSLLSDLDDIRTILTLVVHLL